MDRLRWIKQKPHWLPNEGFWRILQILRILAASPFIFLMVVFLLENGGVDDFLIMAALAIFAFLGMHLVAWAFFWVKAGFSDANKD
ncbi:MAG: hypothetical protein ITG07_00220 [Candidimonas sp.]|nr:hypothetical protein [Candidimonas sp.]